MTCIFKHIMTPGNRKTNSLIKSIIVLCLIIMFFQPEASVAQVISNTGAFISVTSGVVVNSKDIEQYFRYSWQQWNDKPDR